MRNFTAQGELKISGVGSGSSGSSSVAGKLLAHGFLSPLIADDDSVADVQALSIAEDLDGIAVAQSMTEDVELALEPAAAEMLPPRPVVLTSIADLSAITFEIVGTDAFGSELVSELEGPAGVPADDDGIAESQAPTVSVALSLEAIASELAPARPLTFTSSADLSGVNFEIVGTDENGDPQTVASFGGPDNNTLTTSELWSSITSITPDATDAGEVRIGWPDISASVVTLSAYTSVVSITPDASDAGQVEAGWADSAEAYALQLTMNAFDPPRRITLTSSDDLSGVEFEFVGTDTAGDPLTETIDGPSNGTVATTARFATLDSITPLSLGVGDVSAGWGDDTALLYRAVSAVEISHFYARNTSDLELIVDLTLIVDGEEVPWLMFDLSPDEVADVLRGQHASLPLDAGIEIRASIDANTGSVPGAVSFTLHGRQSG